MHYFGTRLSENISRREPEGYLICLNVPVARTGFQQYLPEELGLVFEGAHNATGKPSPFCPKSEGVQGAIGKPPYLIEVYRPESEVFSQETLASFEGMPVTNDHPPDGVDVDNIHFLQMGHAHNVRRGTGSESDLLLADLIITDPHLIDLILAGKREISCGYTYELCEENGRYIQRRIRGNHIAVVDAGRAGSRVSIKDHACERSRKTTMKKSLTKLLARMAKDGGAEAVAEFIEEVMAEKEESPAAVSAAPEAHEDAAGAAVTLEVPEEREITIDNDFVSGILERLDRLIALLTAPAPAEDEDPGEEAAEAVEEILEAAGAVENETVLNPAEAVSEMVESLLEEEPSAVISEQEEDCGSPDPEAANDTLRAVLKAVRPALARMDPAQRRKVCGDIAANVRKARRTGDARVYAGLARAGKPAPNLSDLGRKIMAARNPCYRR